MTAATGVFKLSPTQVQHSPKASWIELLNGNWSTWVIAKNCFKVFPWDSCSHLCALWQMWIGILDLSSSKCKTWWTVQALASAGTRIQDSWNYVAARRDETKVSFMPRPSLTRNQSMPQRRGLVGHKTDCLPPLSLKSLYDEISPRLSSNLNKFSTESESLDLSDWQMEKQNIWFAIGNASASDNSNLTRLLLIKSFYSSLPPPWWIYDSSSSC